MKQWREGFKGDNVTTSVCYLVHDKHSKQADCCFIPARCKTHTALVNHVLTSEERVSQREQGRDLGGHVYNGWGGVSDGGVARKTVDG